MDLLIDGCKSLVIVVGAALVIFAGAALMAGLCDMGDHPACKPETEDTDERDTHDC